MHTQFFTLSLWFSLDISPHYSTIGVLVQSEDKYNSLTAYACFISKANFSLCVPPCVWEIESPLCWTHTDLWLCAWPDKANLLLCVSEELLGKVNIKTNTVNQYNLWRNHIYWQKKKISYSISSCLKTVNGVCQISQCLCHLCSRKQHERHIDPWLTAERKRTMISFSSYGWRMNARFAMRLDSVPGPQEQHSPNKWIFVD